MPLALPSSQCSLLFPAYFLGDQKVKNFHLTYVVRSDDNKDIHLLIAI